MKITKITAASKVKVKIPAPFDQYYRLMSDKEFEDYTGVPAHPTPCEECDGYDIKSYGYAIAKDSYVDDLSDDGMDIVELVTSEWDRNKLMLAYVVHDRIYPVDESDLPEEKDDLYDRDCGAVLIKDAFNIDDADAYKIYDWYAEENAFEDFDSWDDFISYIEDDIYDMLDAADDQLFADRVREAIEGCSNITSSTDVISSFEYEHPEDGWWYHSKHGFGMGTIPRGVTVLDWYEDDHWNTWVLLDRVLNTKELNEYELKEQFPPKGVITHNGDVIEGCSNIRAAECKKVSEDESTIKYVVSSGEYDVDEDLEFIDIDSSSIATYKGYRLQLSPTSGWAVVDKDSKRLKTGIPSESEARDYVDSLMTDIHSSEDVDEEQEEDFLDQPDQEFASAETAINGKQGKLPAVFSKANIPEGALVLDYGGGTVESEEVAQNYLNQFNAKEMLYDPFNQTAEHNRDVIKTLKANGGADVAVCSNVLNVIKEAEVRLDVLNKIKKLLKSGANAYISVYEGGGSGEGAATQNGKSYQNKRKLSTYLDEIQQVFPEAVKKGAVIIAPNTGSSDAVAASVDLSSIDIDKLKSDIVAGCEQYLTSPAGGYLPSGSPKEDKWDMTADEVYVVEVEDEPYENRIKVEVRAELGYNGMINMSSILDRIIEKYDKNAYFEMVEPGIMDAYIFGNNSIEGATSIEGSYYSDLARHNQEVVDYHDNSLIEPPVGYYDAEEEESEPIENDFEFDVVIEVYEDTDWNVVEGDLLYHADLYDDIGISEQTMDEDLSQMLVWHVPTDAGKYNLKGKAHLVYDPEWYALDPRYVFNSKQSNVTDIEISPAGKIESSTKVEATQDIKAMMTEEDLDNAIFNGKPFDLNSFRKWKMPPVPEGTVYARDVKVGDIISVEEDASEVNLGTVVKILAINDPAEDWIEYTFRCECIKDPGRQSLKVGDIFDIHFDGQDPIGPLVEF